MINIYIAGASGAVGSRFVEYIITNKPNYSLVLVSSSIVGAERLSEKFNEYENITIQNLKDLRCIDSSSQNYFVNFAFVSSGIPWARIKRNYDLVKKLAKFCRIHNFKNFVEISSQSVFGFKLNSDVDCHSKFSLWSEEYGLTKRAGEVAARNSLYKSSCKLSIIRLGNVLFRESGPFTQRIYNIYFSKYFSCLNQNGFVNGTLLENTLSGILYTLLNPQSDKQVRVYHFSEVSDIKWSEIYSLINQQFYGYERVHALKESEKENKFNIFHFATTILKSKYSAPLLLLFAFLIPDFINRYFHRLYRVNRSINYNQISNFDNATLNAFSEEFQFKSNYPKGFKLPKPVGNASIILKDIYTGHFD